MNRGIFPQFRPGRFTHYPVPGHDPSIPWSAMNAMNKARRDWYMLKSMRYIKNPLTFKQFLLSSVKYYYLAKYIDSMVLKGWIQRRMGFRTKRYGGAKRFKKRTAGLATKEYVRRTINAKDETHCIISNATLTSTLASATNYTTLLNGLVQGDTDNTRSGDRVRFLKYSGKLQFIMPAGVHGNYRVTIVRFKQPRGANLQPADVWSASPNVYHQYNYNNVDFTTRYDIIKDFTFEVESNYAAQVVTKLVDISFNADELISDYSLGNIGSASDIDKNSYFLMLQTDQTNNATVNISSIFFFKDM